MLHFPAQVKTQENTLFFWRAFFSDMAECLRRADAQRHFRGQKSKTWHLCRCDSKMCSSRSGPWFPLKQMEELRSQGATREFNTGCAPVWMTLAICLAASASSIYDPDEAFVPWRGLITTRLVQRDPLLCRSYCCFDATSITLGISLGQGQSFFPFSQSIECGISREILHRLNNRYR